MTIPTFLCDFNEALVICLGWVHAAQGTDDLPNHHCCTHIITNGVDCSKEDGGCQQAAYILEAFLQNFKEKN